MKTVGTNTEFSVGEDVIVVFWRMIAPYNEQGYPKNFQQAIVATVRTISKNADVVTVEFQGTKKSFKTSNVFKRDDEDAALLLTDEHPYHKRTKRYVFALK